MTDSKTALPEFTEFDHLDRGYLELVFEDEQDIENEANVDRLNADLTFLYGTWSEIDWRDPNTVWIWPGKNQ